MQSSSSDIVPDLSSVFFPLAYSFCLISHCFQLLVRSWTSSCSQGFSLGFLLILTGNISETQLDNFHLKLLTSYFLDGTESLG